MTDAPTDHVTITAADAAGGTPATAGGRYDRGALTAGIAHIGVGNFHRVHEAVYVDELLATSQDHRDWGIVGIGLRAGESQTAQAAAFAEQDGLYTVTAYRNDGAFDSRIVGAMIEYLHGPSDPQAVVTRLTDPAIRIVSLTITEGGYNLDEATGEFRLDDPEVVADLERAVPQTVFGVLVAALRLRREAGTPPFTVLSCDNLRSNGATARTATVGYARAVSDELADWIAANVAFPNSMVDRIAPTVSAETRDRLDEVTGIADRIPALTEDFGQWVLEDDFPTGRPAWDRVGVQLRPDVEVFEAIKQRLLNASHMLLAYPAALLGYRWVHEAASDDGIAALLRTFMAQDSAPLLDPPADVDLAAYQATVLARFANPYVPDTVLRVAHDGAAKLPVFHRAIAQGLLEHGRDPRRTALLLATFRRYLTGVDDAGESFAVQEPHLSEADLALLRDPDPVQALSASPFAAWGLRESADFMSAYLASVELLARNDTRAAVEQALG